jgi:hypothetical protein
MKVTEHNISNWELDDDELETLISLVREEMNDNRDKGIKMFYGMILGKLLIMKNK